MSNSKSKVLIVEDEADLRGYYSFFLERAGYSVKSVTSAEEGLASLSIERPDLIITDYSMGTLNGGDFAVEVRKSLTEVPILVATGNASDEAILRILKLGRAVALHKPFSSRKLIEAVQIVRRLPPPYGDGPESASVWLSSALPVLINRITPGKITHLSTGNIFVECPTPERVGVRCQLLFNIRHDIEVELEVSWVRETDNTQGLNAGMGGRFSAKNDSDIRLIEEFLFDKLLDGT